MVFFSLQKRNTMKLIHVPWVVVLVTILLGEVHAATSDGLSAVKKIALDQSTRYPDGMRVKSVYAAFTNNHSVYVQLWVPSGNDSKYYSLVWQEEVRGVRNDGQPEVIKLNEGIVVNASLRVAIQNTELPGPIDGHFNLDGALRMSKNVKDATLAIGNTEEFDSLPMPRTFDIHLCNSKDCYHMMKHPAKPRPAAARAEEREETLLTRGMIIALIAWNIAITVVLLIAIIAIICVCVDMDNSKSESRRRENLSRTSRGTSRAYENIEEPNNGVEHRWQTSDSWKPDSGMDTIDTTDEQKLTDEKSAL
ncbi:hypothetical protein NP493_1266g00035 [Ridgeia piscesae]|uniref:Uncharacterized protein n=1 Tax=Ridgeia piscesae TaxID=27915 RepID=A0AAD9KAF5_RIDPI|nr:hypothetical protein NP493_1266g00035 [Ridgeia piscesae]